MVQSLNLKIKGLYTSQNELSEVPEGALTVADNIDIIQDSIAEPRRGFERLEAGYSLLTHRTDKTWFYQGKQFAHHGASLYAADTISYLAGGSWTAVSGSHTAPSGFRMRTLRASQNLYFTTSAGVQVLDAYDGTPSLAGVPKALDVAASTTGSSGFLADGFRCAYRVVWGLKDANGNFKRGAPSQRISVKNTAGSSATRDVALTFTIPEGITADHVYQIYRSAQVDNSAQDIEPNDELGLVYEANPTSGQISAKSVSVTDIVPDELRGATIYTAASQDTLVNQNERPPLAKDMAQFRDTIFYANVTSKHRYYLTLLAVDGTNGLAEDDTVTIAGVTYTGKAAESVADAEFAVVTTGSASQNVRDTALSLVRVINQHSSSTVYAYYLSGPDDLPGKILIEERGIGGASFALTSDNDTCWNPTLPSTGTAESSSNDAFINGIAWSKPGQPEAVPLPHAARVGTQDSAILRIIPLKEALYIFKEDGIYRLTGFYPNFDITLLDSSAKLIAQESPAILNNQIFCLTDQGVTVVTDSTKVISRPIEQDLLDLFAADIDTVKTKAFGIAYETERKYYIFLAGDGDAFPTQAYVFNTFTNTWVRHIKDASCGVVDENRLYLGDPNSNYILRDRKTRSYLDYADFLAASSISAIDGTVITLSGSTDLLAVGDILYQSTTKFATILAVDSIASTVEIATDPGFTVDTCDLLKAIQTEIEWAPVTVGNPGILKQFHTCTPLFKSDFQGTGSLKFKSDLSQAYETVPLTGSALGIWGLFAWGMAPWGGVSLKRPVRQWIPRDKQRCSQLTVAFTHAYGFSSWMLQGISCFGEPGSERIGR